MTDGIAMQLGAWLLTYALHSTLLLGAVWLLSRSSRLDHGAREILWKAALVGGVITATLQGALAWNPQGSISIAAGREVQSVAPASELQAVDATREHAPLSSDAATSASTASPSTTSPATPRSQSLPWHWLAWLWVALALPMVIIYAARRLVLTGRIGDRRPVDDPRVLALLDALRSSGEVAGPVQLTASQAISSPVALGGSEICLPATALSDLDAEQLRAMLAHELAHLVRRDPFWLVLACVLERALFFQPLNRVARREILLSAEYLADEWAARRTGGIPLAKALVKVAEWIQASPLGVPVAGFAEERSQLSVRVSRLLDRAAWTAPKSNWRIAMLAFGVVVMMAMVVPGVEATGEPAIIESAISEPMISEPTVTEPLSALTDLELAQEPTSRPPQPPRAPAAVRPPSGSGVSPRQNLAPRDSSLVPALIARLRDEDAEVRRATADALGRFQDPRAISPLVASLDDEDHDVRLAALHALSNFERGVPAAPIRELLASEDSEMRYTATQILGELRDRASIPALTRLTTDSDEEVRWAAIESLEEMDAPISEDLVARVLEDRSDELRQLGLRIAADRRMVMLVPKLIAMLEDPVSDVREQAAEALTEMKTEASHRALRMAITHRDPKVRRVAVSYLGDEGEPQ